jgi:hypothetical protein
MLVATSIKQSVAPFSPSHKSFLGCEVKSERNIVEGIRMHTSTYTDAINRNNTSNTYYCMIKNTVIIFIN